MTDTQALDADTQSGEQNSQETETPNADEQESQPTGFDALPKETQNEIKNLRRENAGYRTKVKGFEDASKTELEKVAGERDDFATKLQASEDRYRASTARASVIEAATKVNARSPQAVYALARDQITFDDEGKATNVETVVKAIQNDEPDLFRKANGTADGGATGSTDKNVKPGYDRMAAAYENTSSTRSRR